ncbi:hypothetical protein N0V87_008687, partial [Didymella glomerata]
MSFTGSFSHRQKSSQEQDTQASLDLNESFTDNRSFWDPGSETFAQPRPEPILADSQDLYSSQLEPDDERATSNVASHLQEQLQTSRYEVRERFSTSSWVARQDQQEPVVGLRSKEAQQQQDKQEDAPSPTATQQDLASISFHASQATTIDETPVDVYAGRSSLSKQELHKVADKLLAHRTYGPPKPEPVGQPAVWADARMDLCETLHYFRSYQGACHSTGGFVRGFMFDKVAHVRDYMDSNVVIARAGGGQVKDKDSGEMKASGDQVEGNHSQNLRNCMAHYNPVVIITGADNPHMPSQPPHQYCVLDYFKPTHIWTEKSGKSNIVRYRRDTHSHSVHIDVSFAHGYRVNRYSIPGIEGFVTHMIANSSVVEEPGGPDEMFEELQGMDIGLRRRPLEGGMLKGGMFTRHFAVNYGMPYKFIAATESHPFPEASHPVSKARSRLNWAARHCLARPAPSSSSSSPTSEQDEAEAMNTSTSSTPALHDFNIHPFNEVLALGYFEGQRISYHDDGESGLGPTIATLSLGAPGMVRIRLKQKHHLGVSNAGIYTDTPPLPGCLQYDARHRLVSELSDLKARVSPSEYRKRLKQIPKELGLKASGNAKDVLTMRVAHGDVVLMHGEALQSLKEGERPG